MELIKKLGTKISESGYLQSYGIFLCFVCNKEVIKQLQHGKAAKSCGCNKNKGENNPMWGKNQTEEARKKISFANEGRKRTEEQKQKQSVRMSGDKNSMFNIHLFGENNPNW